MLSVLVLLVLLLVPLALWFLKKKSAEVPHSAARTAVLVFLLLLVAGFGLCGAWGAGVGLMLLFDGGEGRPYALLFGVPGLVGLGVAGAIYWLTQKARRAETDEPTQND